MTTVLIKKYDNGKLYIPKGNTEKPGRVTTANIIQLVKSGKDVKIIDNVTGDDITAKVLKQGLEYVEVSSERLMELIRG